MGFEPTTTVIGNVTRTPELRKSAAGRDTIRFRIGFTPRHFDADELRHVNGEPLFLNCRAKNEQAANIAATLTVGMQVIVTGRIRPTHYTRDSGEVVDSVYLEVDACGPSLRHASAYVVLNDRDDVEPDPAAFDTPLEDAAKVDAGRKPVTVDAGAKPSPALLAERFQSRAGRGPVIRHTTFTAGGAL